MQRQAASDIPAARVEPPMLVVSDSEDDVAPAALASGQHVASMPQNNVTRSWNWPRVEDYPNTQALEADPEVQEALDACVLPSRSSLQHSTSSWSPHALEPAAQATHDVAQVSRKALNPKPQPQTVHPGLCNALRRDLGHRQSGAGVRFAPWHFHLTCYDQGSTKACLPSSATASTRSP